MAFKFNPFTRNLDLVGSGGGSSYIDGVADTAADLPVTQGDPPIDAVFVVKQGSGVWLINRKPAGLYCRIANNGDLDDWEYLGAFPEVNADGNWALYNSADPSKELKFDVSGVSASTVRTLTVPDKNITIADNADIPSASTATPQALGTAAAGTSADFARGDHVHAMPSASDVGAVSDTDARLSDNRDPNAHAASHQANGTDELFDQSLNTDDDVTFNSVTASGDFSFQSGAYTSNTDGTGKFLQLTDENYYQIQFVSGDEDVRYHVGPFWPNGVFEVYSSTLGGTLIQLDDGQVSEDPAIYCNQPLLLRDNDSGNTVKFDAQEQLSDNVTLTIPDQSGTLALTSDIPDPSAATPQALGTAAAGTSDDYSRGDHIHAAPALNDLSNVSAATPSDNDVLVFDTGTGNWVAEAPSGGGPSGATNLWIPASAWIPRTTAGCGVDSREIGSTNRQNFDELLFDAGTDEFAQALVIMPSNYNNSTITARFYWTAASGSGDVIWGIQGRAFANDDALDTAHGTAQTATDTLLAADDMHVSAATSAVTIGGTPAANTPIQFQVYRDADAGGDTLAVDARLLGVEIIFN